jgi:spore cortex biosynthesis protein YabQ
MHVPVEIQVWRLSVLFLLGVGADLLFQGYRAFRSVFRPRKLGYHLLDILVGLATMAAIGYVVFMVNWGEVRLYVAVSVACGFLASNVLVGDLTYSGSRSTFLRFRRSLTWAWTRVVEPPRKALRQAVDWLSRTMAALPDARPPEEDETTKPDRPLG